MKGTIIESTLPSKPELELRMIHTKSLSDNDDDIKSLM